MLEHPDSQFVSVNCNTIFIHQTLRKIHRGPRLLLNSLFFIQTPTDSEFTEGLYSISELIQLFIGF